MRKTVTRMNRQLYAAALAVSVAGLFAVALVAPASSAPPGLLKPLDRHLNCGPSGGAVICGSAAWTNPGPQTVEVSAIHFGGKNPADFSFDAVGQSDPCSVGLPLQTGESCSLRVVFSPNAPGGRSAKLLVEDSVSGLATPVGVNGRGTGF